MRFPLLKTFLTLQLAFFANLPNARSAEQGFASNMDGIRITAVSAVPHHAQTDDGSAGLCNKVIEQPTSKEGQAVLAQGWYVTAEISAGSLHVVSFVGGAEEGTSGSCLLTDGNIAFFKAGVLKAIAYVKKGADLSIGSVQLQQDGDIRILDGDYLTQPVAVVHLGSQGTVTIQELAALEKVCNGTATVPKINGLPINEARLRLKEAGWSPRASKNVAETEDQRAFALAKQGLTEVDSCSGSGFGYCSFDYVSAAGRLSVTTVGDAEWPSVSAYDVSCD